MTPDQQERLFEQIKEAEALRTKWLVEIIEDLAFRVLQLEGQLLRHTHRMGDHPSYTGPPVEQH